jgi:predicted transposase YdaD
MERAVPDDYDSPWKEAIERYFPDFMHFYFPAAYARIDWQQPYLFLDQELRAVVHDGELGKRFVDKLVRVACLSGQAEWVYIHIEVQGDPQDEFAERMFVYHYRLYDRYRQPIASLAVLADGRANWRPEVFRYESCGCELALRFPVAKLLDWSGEQSRLGDSRNPFAVVTLAHLATRETKDDARARHAAKWRLVQGLYRRGFERQQVVDLFRVIDWMMRLPKDLQTQLRQDLNTLEEESKMVYITSIEQLAIEEGMQKGMQQGMQKGMQQGMQQGRVVGKIQSLERQLQLRFGELPDWVRERLAQAKENELGHWTDAVLSAVSLESMFSDDRH